MIRSKIKLWVDYSVTELNKVISAIYSFYNRMKFQKLIEFIIDWGVSNRT
jgi:hypothetical protein